MRFTKTAGDFSAKVITGTHTILMALNCKDERRKGLLGFAFKKEVVGSGQPPKWLRSLKVFRSIVPNPKDTHDPTDPKKHKAFYTNEFPIQSFLWGDYAASPGTKYRFNIMPMYGKPGALTTDKNDEIDLEIETETEWKPGEGHGVWFNRGAIAGQKFAEEFGNKEPDDIENPEDPTVRWLSRGLLKACLDYINATPPGDSSTPHTGTPAMRASRTPSSPSPTFNGRSPVTGTTSRSHASGRCSSPTPSPRCATSVMRSSRVGGLSWLSGAGGSTTTGSTARRRSSSGS